LLADGMLPIGDMTVRGRVKAAEVIGVGGKGHPKPD